MKRYLQTAIADDALKARKIAFISGPRQVGKTSMAEAILAEFAEGNGAYCSWDDDEFKKIWVKNPKAIVERNGLVVLDEIHKDRQWKNRLKGLYDLYRKTTRFIVTGSARLDFFRKSGDSLQGRYFPYRLHPVSLNERDLIPPPPKSDWDGELKTSFELEDLLRLSGFPEPLLGQSAEKAQRWRRLYRERMIREDLRDLKEVKDLEQVRLLSVLLEDLVGSALSYEALREDLKVAFDTVRSWIELLEAVYYCYRIRPYSKGIKQSLRKEPKLYLFDWCHVQNEGARLENLVANHLLKSCHAWTDCAFGEYELHYLRDKQKREVDFMVTENGKPYLLVEVKSGKSEPTPAMSAFTAMLKPKFSIQVVKKPNHERKPVAGSGVRIMDVRRFLSRLA